MFQPRTLAVLKARDVEYHDVMADIQAGDRDSAAAQVLIAKHVLQLALDMDSALSRLESALYWVKNATERIESYLDTGRNSLNSLGALQAQGPALDVAVSLACEREAELGRLVEMYVTIRTAG